MATSVVPPPMSQTMLAVGSAIGNPTPIAAALASGMTHTWPGPGAVDAIEGGPLFDRRVMQPGTPTNARAPKTPAGPLRLAEEVAEHRLAQFKVGDHPVMERPDDRDRVGRAPFHLLGQVADRAAARQDTARCPAARPRSKAR